MDDRRGPRLVDAGADVLDGGAGFDLVSYESMTEPLPILDFVIIDLNSPVWSDSLGDTFIGIEGVIGTALDDLIVGRPDVADTLIGGAGGDVLYGGGGGGYSARATTGTAVVCSGCGQQTTVPFEPRGDRPVFCRDCFQAQKGGGGGGGRGGGGGGRGNDRGGGRGGRY